MYLIGIYERMETIQQWIARFEKGFGIFTMAFIIGINIYGITSRYFFDQPIIYIHELTILGAVWIFFIGMGLVFKVHSDITVDFLFKRFSKRMRMIDDLIVDILSLFFLVMLAWQTWKFIPYTRGESHVLSFALELPDEIYYYPVGIGAISIFLTVFHNLVGRLVRWRTDWRSAV
jgi:TRAP-type C4-dicarboxylate transport system permease small subunit